MGCILSFPKAEWWVLLSKYATPDFNIFDIGVTQASISFKNDCKISQSLAEFETHAIDSLNYSLLIGYGWAQTCFL